MTTTLRDIIDLPDQGVYPGINRVVRALIVERDGNVDLDLHEFSYDLDGAAAQALEARVTVRVKYEDLWDGGDGREAVDVVCLDGRPVAVVMETGYDSYNYTVEVIDLRGLDELVDAVRSLRVSKMANLTEADLDADVSARFRLLSAATTPGTR